MESTIIKEDIKVCCVEARSFPEDILQAHQKLHSQVPFSPQRRYFGISWQEPDDRITYRAAAEMLPGDIIEEKGLLEMIVKAGNYLYIDIEDYMKNTSAIGAAFARLVADERIGGDTFCLEWYLNNRTCRCMVKTQ